MSEIDTARLRWDEAGLPISDQFDDYYHSRVDGLAESRYVFLEQNRLAERFSALNRAALAQRRFVVGETGFGSGLNFLTTWQLWRAQAPADACLHFVSVDRYPLQKADLTRALSLWPELTDLANALIEQYPPPVGPGFHRLHFDGGRVCLTLIFDDASRGLEQLLRSGHPAFTDAGPKVDAWLLDGFSPAKNATMWTPELFSTLARLSHPHTTLATFTAASLVQRGLSSEGFALTKVPGFGGKREMLRARFQGLSADTTGAPTPHRLPGKPPLPWAVPAANSRRSPSQPGTAMVIGGGLAGCHTARVLAERGWQVTLLERHPRPAQEASGNPQGLLYARLSPQDSPLARFNLLSLAYAQRFYRPYWQSDRKLGEACGLLQLATGAKEQAVYARIAERFIQAPELVQPMTASQASERAGLSLPHPALFFPSAGWLNPAALCEALLAHPNIRLGSGADIETLSRESEQWVAQDQAGQQYRASIAIMANARAARDFSQTAHLPLKTIRGQITQTVATDQSRKLRVALCADGYLAPAADAQHCLGATFNLATTDPGLDLEDQRANLDQLSQFGPEVAGLFAEQPVDSLAGRVGFRCTTPDYLPLVGPAPDRDAFLEDFAELRKDARLNIAKPGRYHPGLFINVGHGSRGLCYTPLSAELLVAHIEEEPAPLDRELVQALHPARFLIRDLMRNKI